MKSTGPDLEELGMTTPKGGDELNPDTPPRAGEAAFSQKSRGGFERPASSRGRSATAAQFSLDCLCGRTIAVLASQAGSKVRCDCGAELDVPSLSRLRDLAGK